MNALFECDQCAYQEWRHEDQEPWLCAVCGNMRWSVLATEDVASGDAGGGKEAGRRDGSEPGGSA